MRRYVFQTLVLLFATTIWVSCDKNDDDDTPTVETYSLSGNGSGALERPTPATTTATGTITGTYSKADKMLHYTITWTGLTGPPVAMHFHGPAAADTFAGVRKPITGYPEQAAGTVSGMDTLSADEEAELLGGLWYYNIHTDAYKGGEVRGNITATAD